ncbi:hypothetical protein uan_018 [Pseudomonas phage UAntarctica]|nr:hypothetical protein uan_018 [Pseudomonas phage UAntarctica]
MKFEITGAGFDGGTDETDERVLWVTADTEAQVQEAVTATGASYTSLGLILSSVDIDYTLPADAVPLRQRLLGWNS